MVRGGTDPKVAMDMSGHETHGTLERYNITSLDDQHQALARLRAHREELARSRAGKVVELQR